MSTITDFKELKVWKISRVLNKQIFSEVLQKDDIKDYALKDQLNRSAGSVMDIELKVLEGEAIRNLSIF